MPRVDRAQRLGPRHHADRAVRVDDGDDDLPAQPRAGQAARRAAGPARHPARRPERRHHEPALPAGRRADRADPDRGRRDRGRHAAHRARRVGHLPGRRGLHDPRDGARRPTCCSATARRQERRRGRRRGAPAGLRPARVRHPAAGRRRALPRLRGPAGPPDRPDRRRRLAGARRGREPGGPAAALGGLPGRRRVGAGDACSRTSRAASTTAPGTVELELPPRSRGRPDRRPAPVLAALPDHRHDAPSGRQRRELLARAGDLLDLRAAPIGARLPATHASLDRARDRSASPTARPARSSRCATSRS